MKFIDQCFPVFLSRGVDAKRSILLTIEIMLEIDFDHWTYKYDPLACFKDGFANIRIFLTILQLGKNSKNINTFFSNNIICLLTLYLQLFWSYFFYF